VRFVQATSSQSNVDAIRISNTNDGGKPDAITDLAAVPGAADGTIDLTWTATGDDPGGVGTAAQYQVRMSNRPILTDNDWYSAKVAPGIVPVPQAAGNPETMTVTNLVQGVKYWFAIRAIDNVYFYSDLSNTVNAVSTYSGGYPGAGTYWDTDANWQYYGSWITTNVPQALDGTQHVTTLVGSSAVFHFNGTGFTLIFQKGPGLSKLIVYVDGQRVGSINQENDVKVFQSTQTFDGFAAGNHVVQFAFEGGDGVNIDAITILP
jgi:hypothetical protein